MWNLINGAWTIAGFIKMYMDRRKRVKKNGKSTERKAD
tara:strand:- start:14 stop:127 length:114 start_codon:yes stop_codon:yes gene_type:complete